MKTDEQKITSYIISFGMICGIILVIFAAWIFNGRSNLQQENYEKQIQLYETEREIILDKINELKKYRDWHYFLDTASNKEIHNKIQNDKKRRLGK